MNHLKFFLIVLFTSALLCTLPGQQLFAQHQLKGMHPQQQIDFVKKQLKAQKEPYLSAYRALLVKADSALLVAQHAVEDFSIPGFYVDKESHRRTSRALQIDGFSAYSCALAYQLSGRKKYADKAVYFLNAWASVNKKYSQLDGSLVMSYAGTALMISADLLKGYKGWQPKAVTQFKWWTKNVFRAAANSIRYRNNNSGDWSRLASILADTYLEDQEDLQQNISLIKKDLFDKIAADGHLVEEVKRQGKGIWYTYFSLAPLTASSWIIYNQTGENLFQLSRGGASFKKALDYLFYYNQHPEEWKFFKNPDTGSVHTITGFWPANLLEAMNSIYPSPQFDDYLAPYRPIMYTTHDYAWTFPTLMPLRLNGYQ
ncbi:alginate lyase family protein [Pedobacter sp.]|uniref:alginate lyase family protein n=1 Tax=Pedobacter sp. TaxID=1411316 RepID=UPI0031DAC5FB